MHSSIFYIGTLSKKKKKTTNFLCLYVNVEAELSQLHLPSHFFHSVTPNLSFTGFNLHQLFSNLNAPLKTIAGKARL